MTPAEIGLSAVVTILGGGQVWTWLTSRGKHQVDLITLGQSIAEATIKGMKIERDELLAELGELRSEVAALKDQVDELVAHSANLEGALKAAGVTPPARPRRKAA